MARMGNTTLLAPHDRGHPASLSRFEVESFSHQWHLLTYHNIEPYTATSVEV